MHWIRWCQLRAFLKICFWQFFRQQCYKCILDVLQRLLVLKTTPSQSPGRPSRPGPPPAPDPNALTSSDAEKHVSFARTIVLH